MTAEISLSSAADGRLARTVAAVRTLIEDATGIALQETDSQTSFTELGLDSLMMGLFLPEDNLHAPNESFHLGILKKGIQAFLTQRCPGVGDIEPGPA